MEQYAEQPYFHYRILKAGLNINEKSYPSRPLPLAESLAVRGDFYTHTGRMNEAAAMLKQAAQSDSNSAVAHENLGLFYYHQRDMENAATEFQRATELNPNTFISWYYLAASRHVRCWPIPKANWKNPSR